VEGSFNVITHGLFRSEFVSVRKRRQNCLVLGKRLFRYPGMKHQAEDVEMGVQVGQRIADQPVARDLHDLVVEVGVEPRKSGDA
jgi:hypothetical protein